MSATYRVVKTYLLIDEEDHQQVGIFASILFFHRIWDNLTKPQRAALLTDDRASVRKITLDKLRQHNLIDPDGNTTIVGEAVLHYRPDGPIGHALLELHETAQASPPTTDQQGK